MADDITIKIGAKNTASKVLKTVGSDVKTFNTRMKSAAAGVGRFVFSLKGLVAAGAAGAVLKTIGNEMERIDEIAKTGRALGIITDDLIGLRLAAEEFSGIASSQLNVGLKVFARNIGEAAEGTGQAREEFNRLGLDARKLRDLGLGPAFNLVADAVGNLATQADKAAVAQALFGRSGTDLINTLDAGSKEINKMKDRAKELGETFSDDVAKHVEQANDSITEMKRSFLGLATSLTGIVAPAITVITKAITDLTFRISGRGGLIDQIQLGYAGAVVAAMNAVSRATGGSGLAPVLGVEGLRGQQDIGAQLIATFKALGIERFPSSRPVPGGSVGATGSQGLRGYEQTTALREEMQRRHDKLLGSGHLFGEGSSSWFGLKSLLQNLPNMFGAMKVVGGGATPAPRQNLADDLFATQGRLLTTGRTNPMVEEAKKQTSIQEAIAQAIENGLIPAGFEAFLASLFGDTLKIEVKKP